MPNRLTRWQMRWGWWWTSRSTGGHPGSSMRSTMWCRSRVRVGDNSAHWDGAGVAGRLGSALRLQGGQQCGAVGFADDSYEDGGGGAGWLGGAVGGGCGHQGSQIYKQLKQRVTWNSASLAVARFWATAPPTWLWWWQTRRRTRWRTRPPGGRLTRRSRIWEQGSVTPKPYICIYLLESWLRMLAFLDKSVKSRK